MPQLVDPFIPVRGQPKRPAPTGQYGRQWLRKTDYTNQPTRAMPRPLHIARSLAVDSVRPATSPPIPRHRLAPPEPPKPKLPPQPMMRTNATASPISPLVRAIEGVQAPTEPKPLKRIVRLLKKLELPFIVLIAVFVGMLAQSLIFGEIAIGLYAIYALIRRIESRTTFALALVTLIGIVIEISVKGVNHTATNFAVYVFLLLTVGVISLGAELYRGDA